ncbi:MAG: type III-B CRISPR-associated protein Cas10/Cmr2 [Microcoleaceae cyanobacterium]
MCSATDRVMSNITNPSAPVQVHHRKLYALLHSAGFDPSELSCLLDHSEELKQWWSTWQSQVTAIAQTSDQAVFQSQNLFSNKVKVSHLISGEEQWIENETNTTKTVPNHLISNNIEQTFWGIWRFYPGQFQAITQEKTDTLLYPANFVLPDCPQHSYNSTVSALVGAMFPNEWQEGSDAVHPYLLLFNFSPVQEFIKASRKFLDYWAGSYLLHYLSAIACWYIAERYGPDMIVTPSLWSQEIIDAMLLQKYSDLEEAFNQYLGNTPPNRYKTSNSLNTAGFPNLITTLVPGKKAAKKLGEDLSQYLKATWLDMGKRVREVIKTEVISLLNTPQKQQRVWNKIKSEFPDYEHRDCIRDLEKWAQGGCWEWNKLWDSQLTYSWETYWTMIPLGAPTQPLQIQAEAGEFSQNWLQDQTILSQPSQDIPTAAERTVFAQSPLNVGTWWGSLQSRLGRSLPAVKNTRNWLIPAAPGERSTLSGQFSAVHPMLHYKDKFREGGGLSGGTMRLFWRVMAEAFPGLFNGSEKLNALELTKRMAWEHGGITERLGITLPQVENEADTEERKLNADTSETDKEDKKPVVKYEDRIRFPNLSSIAAARFIHNHPQQTQQYHRILEDSIKQESIFSNRQRKAFHYRTRRSLQVPKTDEKFKEKFKNKKGLNGSMFSSKWLAEDMEVEEQTQVSRLKNLVDQAHKDCGFGENSPADWWVIVLADGDSMGKYVSGSRLKAYEEYINSEAIPHEVQSISGYQDFINTTRKRMGPATHIGLNRALLDFSNRLVPAITEKRFCGRVIYSGGDDVMAVLPIEDLPEYLNSLRAAWSSADDPQGEFDSRGGYLLPKQTALKTLGLDNRPYFTMGTGATMSMGIVIAHKSVPLPTVLEQLWKAEKDRAKKIPDKDGFCFRVIYGSGNTLEALMKGTLLPQWCQLLAQLGTDEEFSSLLYRLSEELPRRCQVTADLNLFKQATQVILNRRDKQLTEEQQKAFLDWIDQWEKWAHEAASSQDHDSSTKSLTRGTQPQDLGNLLRFTAFWVDRMTQRVKWAEGGEN